MNSQIISIEAIREELLLCNEERAAALRAYLAEEEARQRSEDLLNRRLERKFDRRGNYCI